MKIFTFPIRCIYFFPLPYLLYLALRVIRLKAMRAACLCGGCFSPFVFYLCVSALICGCFSSVSYASPPPSTDVHFCKIIDYEALRARNSRYAATKQALNLNVGEPRTVRMIYFLPNDRPFQQEVVDSMKVTIRQVQTFFADQMEAHGHGRKTFRFETDAQGEPVVHRVDGQHPYDYYREGDGSPETEIDRKFDTEANNVYISLYSGILKNKAGMGVGNKYRGYAIVNGFGWLLVAHELGHAFGLWHDWRDGDYIMSYGAGNTGRWIISACAAEFLSVHPFFNPDIPYEETGGPTIELISPNTYPTGSTSISIRLRISDPDGLHQVLLFNRDAVSGIKMCRELNGETEAIVQFDYDGVIPSSDDPHGTGTSLSNPLTHRISVSPVDIKGNAYTVGGDRSLSESFIFFDASLKGNSIATLQGHADEVFSVSFSPDGTTLASGSADGTIKLWDVVKRQNIATLEGHTSWINSLAFSPDGKTLASGSLDGTVKLWDMATKTNIAILEEHSPVQSVSFSPDGKTLASGSGYSLNLWDVSTGTNIATLDDRSSQSVSFSPDGKTLASSSWDKTVKLWDVMTRTNIAILEGHTSGIYSVSFSPDGKTLASGSRDNTVKLWDVSVALRPSPVRLVKISGDKQQGTPGAALANPLVVEVKDQDGSVLEGVAVTFSVIAGDGTLSASADTTDANGRAQTTLTLGNSLETNLVAVTVGGIEQPVTFVIEAMAKPDFNGDGAVNIADFLLFVAQFGFSQADEGYDARFDLDGDGVIGIGDFLIFVNNFGNAGS